MSEDALSLAKVAAQQVLDDLWSQDLIPVQLRVGQITQDVDQYTVYFYDSRFYLVVIPLTGENTFAERFRTAVLSGFIEKYGPT